MTGAAHVSPDVANSGTYASFRFRRPLWSLIATCGFGQVS